MATPVPVYPGQALSGAGIPAGAIVLSVTPGGQSGVLVNSPDQSGANYPASITMSAPATADGSGVTITAASA
ncbi:hypothetical protein [Methylocella sp.]|uniref:hypothetical protein n=1 Tax=Methylocella sp. TaxID=1978226 RepID=UPI0035B49B0D